MQLRFATIFSVFILLFAFSSVSGQKATTAILDTIPINNLDSLISVDSLGIGLDSLGVEVDSLGNPVDSLRRQNLRYETSEDAIEDEIDYGSVGRKKIDIANKIVHLWDAAYVNYQDIQVKGDYITFDFQNSIATAIATYDTSGQLISKATFVEGENTFQYDYLKYNFKTKKAFVKQAVTKEGELFVHGSKTKYVQAIDSSGEDCIYNQDAIITSCNLDHPHFGIRSNKIKVVPNKLAIIGPSRLELANVPTPLWLPFGFFPIANGKSSGLILPKSYDFSQAWGFGFQNVGYYFPINDYFDAKVTGDIYLRGSWSLNTQLNYNKRYKYSGNFRASRSSRRNENTLTGGYDNQVSYEFRWIHNQDVKAHPYRKFNASVDLKTAGFNRLNRTDAQRSTQDNVGSSIRYSYQFGTSPWDISAGASFSQSLSRGTVTMKVPEGKLNMRRLEPFKKKERVGKEKWYEKIGVTYSSQFKNLLTATDTTFYTREAWDDAKYGIDHRASASASFKFLKYFSFNPSASYNEIWFFKEVDRSLSDELVIDSVGQFTDSEGIERIQYDTTYGEIIEDINNTFLPFRTGNLNAGIATKLFWTEQRQKGFFRGFRHTVTPTASLSYGPDSKTRYERTFDTDLRDNIYDPETYSVIPSGVFSASGSEERLSTTFKLENLIDIKYYSKRDSSVKKLTLTNFTFNSDYNFVRDSFKLTDPTLRGRSNFFKGKMTLNYGFRFSPYKLDNGRVVDEYFFQDGFEAPRLEDFTLNTTTRLPISDIRKWITGEKMDQGGRGSTKETKKTIDMISLGELFDNFSFTYKIDYSYRNNNGIVTNGISNHSFNLQGNIQITDNWALNLGNFGYDFKRKGYTYPDLGFSRDLHCWTMAFAWQPQGAANFSSTNTSTFTFSIRAKSQTLDFLKYDYRKGNFDF